MSDSNDSRKDQKKEADTIDKDWRARVTKEAGSSTVTYLGTSLVRFGK